MAPKKAKSDRPKSGRSGKSPLGNLFGGPGGFNQEEVDEDYVPDAKLDGLRLDNLVGTTVNGKGEENKVWQALEEYFEPLTNAFVHYCKVHGHDTVYNASRLTFGAPPTQLAMAASLARVGVA